MSTTVALALAALLFATQACRPDPDAVVVASAGSGAPIEISWRALGPVEAWYDECSPEQLQNGARPAPQEHHNVAVRAAELEDGAYLVQVSHGSWSTSTGFGFEVEQRPGGWFIRDCRVAQYTCVVDQDPSLPYRSARFVIATDVPADTLALSFEIAAGVDGDFIVRGAFSTRPASGEAPAPQQYIDHYYGELR